MTLYLISFLLTLCLIYKISRSHKIGLYGLFHLSLNKDPGQPSDTDPRTEWLNMGYWKVTDATQHIPGQHSQTCSSAYGCIPKSL